MCVSLSLPSGRVVEPGEAGHLHLLLPPPAVSSVRRDHQRGQQGAGGLPEPDETALQGSRRPPSCMPLMPLLVGVVGAARLSPEADVRCSEGRVLTF